VRGGPGPRRQRHASPPSSLSPPRSVRNLTDTGDVPPRVAAVVLLLVLEVFTDVR
jgi:hypothetical protein